MAKLLQARESHGSISRRAKPSLHQKKKEEWNQQTTLLTAKLRQEKVDILLLIS